MSPLSSSILGFPLRLLALDLEAEVVGLGEPVLFLPERGLLLRNRLASECVDEVFFPNKEGLFIPTGVTPPSVVIAPCAAVLLLVPLTESLTAIATGGKSPLSRQSSPSSLASSPSPSAS